MDALTLHRLHFAFTITYHYLFPQLTMGLALLIVVLKTLALRTGDAHYDQSAFLGLFLFGSKRLSPKAHWASAFLVCAGSWLSGFFIIVANAWMQHPVAYHMLPNGVYEVSSFWALMLNPWAWLEYAHNMSGAVITGAFVMASVGALYLLQERDVEYG